jgi:glycerate dehydrogenase
MAAPPRIVVIDGYTLNPGDQSWGALAALGSLSVFERSTRDELIERAAGAHIVLTNKAVLDAGVLEALPELRYIGVTATGTNVVDREAARARGVVVCNVPSYGADSVAEHTLAMLLEASKHMSEHLRAVRDGAWSRQPDFSFTVHTIGCLAQKTLGIVGLGAIGQRVAELALAFRMQVLAARHPSRPARTLPGVEHVALDALLERSDFVSLHCPLTAETSQMIDAARLARMKTTAVLVNTSRGGLIDEAALAAALASGRLRAAYLDVLATEPPPAGHPLVALPHCHVSPHIAWASIEARRRLLDVSVANVRAFLGGKPENVVT